MPTTRLKNTVYRLLLPFQAPRSDHSPVSGQSGHQIHYFSSFSHLIRKHHVLGSATLLSDGVSRSCLFTSSSEPPHNADLSTFFRVASITKVATAFLTVMFADRGILDLDCPVVDYFRKDFGLFLPENITLRHLLSHTSGIMDPPTLESDLEAGKTLPEILPGALHDGSGTSFHYSNLGFGIIGCVMEAVLGRPVPEIFEKELFTPLCMKSTLEGCRLPSEQIMPVTRVLPYRKGTDLILTPLGSHSLTYVDPIRHFGHTAGSMYTDISSLFVLFKELIFNSSHLISDSSLAMMKKRHAVYGKLSPTLAYGLGMLIIQDKDISESRIIGHQGFAYGCADGAFFEEDTGNLMITLNGGCSEARVGRLGAANRDFLRWAFRKELPSWSQ